MNNTLFFLFNGTGCNSHRKEIKFHDTELGFNDPVYSITTTLSVKVMPFFLILLITEIDKKIDIVEVTTFFACCRRIIKIICGAGEI